MPHDLYGNQLSTEQWHANINGTLDELKNHYHPRPNPGLVLENEPNRRVLCCAGPYFAMERWTLTQPYTEPAHARRCSTLTNVSDNAIELQFSGGTESLSPGESCILPAAIGEVQLVPQGEASLVVCYVPDMDVDVIRPLQAAGHSDEQIQQLGEVPVYS
jgi:mannose-6-phosphate isomerase